MPVLMNKGSDPRKAAWLFYSSRPQLAEFGRAAVEGRFESGVLRVDADALADARKASSELAVYLDVETVVPEGVDLEAARGEVMERVRMVASGDVEKAGGGIAPVDEGASDDAGTPDNDEPAYEPVAAPEGLSIVIGTTTRLAAENYLREVESEDAPWRPELPGLQMLAQLVSLMEQSGAGIPACVVWHVDEGGIMRMAPAKQVKPMAGNTLKVKL